MTVGMADPWPSFHCSSAIFTAIRVCKFKGGGPITVSHSSPTFSCNRLYPAGRICDREAKAQPFSNGHVKAECLVAAFEMDDPHRPSPVVML
jgi:hypothetical protein